MNTTTITTNNTPVVKMESPLEMVGFLKTNGTACRFVAIIIDTAPKLKVACPFKNVRKVAKKIGIINANYNTSVRRKIAEILDVDLSRVEYENGEVWYKHLMTSDDKALPVVVNKKKEDGKHYLQYFPRKSEHKYINGDTGEVIDEETLKPFFYAQSERPNFKPCVISVDLSNVRQLKASGVVIEMPEFEEAEAVLTAED